MGPLKVVGMVTSKNLCTWHLQVDYMKKDTPSVVERETAFQADYLYPQILCCAYPSMYKAELSSILPRRKEQ